MKAAVDFIDCLLKSLNLFDADINLEVLCDWVSLLANISISFDISTEAYSAVFEISDEELP